jgi:hypothetical protein
MESAISLETTARGKDELNELNSLAQMLIYARQTAQDLKSDFSVYCLDMALMSLLEEIGMDHQLKYRH